MGRVFPVETVGYSHLAIPDNEFRRTEFYADFLKPNHMAYCMGVIAKVPGGTRQHFSRASGHLGVVLSTKNKAKFLRCYFRTFKGHSAYTENSTSSGLASVDWNARWMHSVMLSSV